MVRPPVQAHPRSTRPNGQNTTRSSAPAWHCIHASQMVRTPVQVHPRSTVPMPANRKDHPFRCTGAALYACQQKWYTRAALYPCQPNGKNTPSSAALCPCQPNGTNTRSSAPCVPTSKMVRAPIQVHPHRAHVRVTRAALYPCQPNGKTPVQAHPDSTVSLPAKW